MSKIKTAGTKGSGPVFSPLVAGWLVAAGVFGFCGYLVLSAFAPDLRNGVDGGAHALSRSAVGFAGLVRLLKAEGEVALISRRTPGRRETPPALTVITPDISTDGDALAKRAASGRVLIVLPKWITVPDYKRQGWVTPFRVVDQDAIKRKLNPILPAVTVSHRDDIRAYRLISPGAPVDGMTTASIVHLQVFRAVAALRPVVTDAEGDAILASTPDDRIFVLSDPDLLNTRGLRELAGARVANALINSLRRPGDPVVFDVSVNGFGSPPSLLKLALKPPFLGATLCLLAAALLMGLHAVSRFGAPLAEARVLALGKQALADNSAALIRLARREPHMARRYLALTRAAVIQALGAGRMPADQVDAFLERVGEQVGARQRLAALTRAATGARDRAEALAAARDLHQWRLEMTREPQ